MNSSQKKIRVHVHWLMKFICISTIILFPFRAVYYFQHNSSVMGFVYLVSAFLAVPVLFLTNAKIDVDQTEICLTTSYGVFVIKWNEIKSVEQRGVTTYFYSETKSFRYSLLLSGKGKQEFQKEVSNIIRKRQIPSGRPDNLTNDKLQTMLSNAKIRGWKLF